MNEAAYLQAALPEPVRCLGQSLEPYSLIHEMLLRQQQNVFALSPEAFDQVNPDADRILSHLFLGCYVTCHAFPEVLTALRRPDLPKIGQEWRDRARKEGIDEEGEVRRFKGYLLTARYCPPFEPVRRRGRKQFATGSPWLLMLFKTLVANLNFSRAEAFNTPYAEAQFLYLSYWESQGTVRLLTEEMIEQQRKDEAEVHAAAEADGMTVMRFPGRAAAPGGGA